jgi:UDP-N-acetylmuramoyl-tripeptide--D-alanyl-D-alanine ligase
MIELNASLIASYVNGTRFGSDMSPIQSVAVDSRKVIPGSVFFALKGQTTDGHRFVQNAKANGAVLAVVDHHIPEVLIDQIVVSDCFEALKDLARAYLSNFKIPKVAVTGSSGKTTTKDITASVLSSKFITMKTPGNLNSSTGAPLSVFELKPEDEIAVFELSMSSSGEILANADIIRPNCVLMTNIGYSHIEFLGSRENIFAAKCEILTYLKEGDIVFVNSHDDMLSTLTSDTYTVKGVGTDEGDLQATDVVYTDTESVFTVLTESGDFHFTFPLPGKHYVIDCLLAIGCALHYGLTEAEIQSGFDQFAPSPNRMEIVKLGGITLLNDTYNANPDSMRAAIDSLDHFSAARKILVLGDMFELGDMTLSLTESVGAYASQMQVDMLLVNGASAPAYLKGFQKETGLYFESKDDLTKYLLTNLRQGDSVLFKASRGMAFDEIFRSVREKLS